MAAGCATIVMICFTLGLFNWFPTIIYGGSMSPALRTGDVVIVSKVSANSIEIGDIVQFAAPGGDHLHRVVEINGAGRHRTFITQGDANINPDPEPVSSSQIKGRVLFNFPNMGWVAVGVRNLLFSPD